jgi:hypothetical protein
VSRLAEVKKWMRWFGWTNLGGPGSTKIEADGRPSGAVHGDTTWQRDIEEALRLEGRQLDKVFAPLANILCKLEETPEMEADFERWSKMDKSQ